MAITPDAEPASEDTVTGADQVAPPSALDAVLTLLCPSSDRHTAFARLPSPESTTFELAQFNAAIDTVAGALHVAPWSVLTEVWITEFTPLNACHDIAIREPSFEIEMLGRDADTAAGDTVIGTVQAPAAEAATAGANTPTVNANEMADLRNLMTNLRVRLPRPCHICPFHAPFRPETVAESPAQYPAGTMNANERVPAWMLAVAAMLSVQLGAAISVGLFPDVGVGGTAWLRISFGAIGFILIARPKYWKWSLAELRAPIALGIISAIMTVSFLSALDRLPLGTTVAIEFLGPLTVAAVHSKSVKSLAWPALALIGVVLLTEPWLGELNLLGIMFAAIAAAGWGCYIIITQHVGDRFQGVDGLAIALPAAAIVTAFIGVPQAWGHITWQVLGIALVAALLFPIIAWSLEMFALRRLNKAAFGTLMSVEPALALVIGILVLHQIPMVFQLVGIVCVVVAGIAAERTGKREDDLPELEGPAG